MVALRTPRRPPEPPAAAPAAAPVAAPVEQVAPLSDSPMRDNLEVARDSIPDPQPDMSALQAQLAAVQQAEAAQREAFEKQRQIAAQMQIEREQPKEPPQLSERDLEFLGARPGVQNDPAFNQAVQALAHVYQYGSDDFYRAMELKYPVSNFRRVEPRQEELAAAPHCGRTEADAACGDLCASVSERQRNAEWQLYAEPIKREALTGRARDSCRGRYERQAICGTKVAPNKGQAERFL